MTGEQTKMRENRRVMVVRAREIEARSGLTRTLDELARLGAALDISYRELEALRREASRWSLKHVTYDAIVTVFNAVYSGAKISTPVETASVEP